VQSGPLRQTAAVLSQSSFLSYDDRRLHFGLGTARVVDAVAVRWPSGREEKFTGAEVDSLWLLKEGAGQARRVVLPR
jgi:hypothetical protein